MLERSFFFVYFFSMERFRIAVLGILLPAAAVLAQLPRTHAAVPLGITYEKLEFIIDGLVIESDSNYPDVEIAYGPACNLTPLGTWEGEFDFFHNKLFRMKFSDSGSADIFSQIYAKLNPGWDKYRLKKSTEKIVWTDVRTRIGLTLDPVKKTVSLEISDIEMNKAAKRYRRIQDDEPVN